MSKPGHLRGDDYSDLVDAVQRGSLRTKAAPPIPKQRPSRESYTVASDTWQRMLGELFVEVTADAGSFTEAAAWLGLRAAELATWIAWINGPDHGLRGAYLVRTQAWRLMELELLCSFVADVGSQRRAARRLSISRSTLGAKLRRARERNARELSAPPPDR